MGQISEISRTDKILIRVLKYHFTGIIICYICMESVHLKLIP